MQLKKQRLALGEELLKLSLGLRINYSWSFLIANIDTAAFGADFINV